MANVDEILLKGIMKETRYRNSLEERIAQELYGCSFQKLGYDEREEVILEAEDRMLSN